MSKASKIGYFKNESDLDVPVDMKMSRIPRPQDISYYLKQNKKASMVEYHETDRLEVKEVIINKPGVRLGIRGLLINKPTDKSMKECILKCFSEVYNKGISIREWLKYKYDHRD